MARDKNFLLGAGERLVSVVSVPQGGGDKNPPYTFQEARRRLAPRLSAARLAIDALPSVACPDDKATALVTMHPRYISKSDFPIELLDMIGLHVVGSRPRPIRPDKWGIQDHPSEAIGEQLVVAGKRVAFARWADQQGYAGNTQQVQQQLTHVEDVTAYMAADRIKGNIPKKGVVTLEVVLHNDRDDRVVQRFVDYVVKLQGEPLISRRRDVGGLTFIPVRAASSSVVDVANFAFVRVVRSMPKLRPIRPSALRAVPKAIQMPSDGPSDRSFRALIFDGGVSPAATPQLARWVNVVDPPGIGKAVPDYESHGLAVTGALLFGPLSRNSSALPVPVCAIDHVRVLDEESGSNSDLQYLDAIDRIDRYLQANNDLYDLVNISLGPDISIDDDEVTEWTAVLDERLAQGRILTTIAAGNNGRNDRATGLHRVQPPADAVNALTVGAADSNGGSYQRAEYSACGPGRCPGVVKPDGIAFGGSATEPFYVLSPGLVAVPEEGTSFAAPFVLRSATLVRAQLGAALSPLAIRALLIHRADGKRATRDAGWGRFETNGSLLVTCDDDEALVVFQGDLPVREHLRAPVPLPRGALTGRVLLTATLVISPETDAAHPGAYTRAGLEVAFRPHSGKKTTYPDGKISKHASTKQLFAPSKMYEENEFVLREDGSKWEPCMKGLASMNATSLLEPCFDIRYHHRESGAKASDPRPIPYALVVSIKAPKVPDLYNRVVRTYAQILVPIQPRLRISV